MKNKRIYIVGNSGSGKSYLAKKLKHKLNINILHLAQIFWENVFCTKRKQELINKDLFSFIENNQSFVIEGVFRSLERSIIQNTNLLIYLDLPWKEVENNLKNRNSQKINYYKTYYKEKRISSHGNIVYSKGSHDQLFQHFNLEKIKLKTKKELNEFIDSFNNKK